MNPLVTTLILILLALLGARFSFSTIRVAMGPRLLLRTGIHFLFVGFVLGPHALGLLSVEAVEQLFPLLALGLGWVGFLFGLQLDRTALGKFPRSWIAIALVQASATFLIFLAVGWAALVWLGFDGAPGMLFLTGAAATAAVSAPAGVALVSSNFLVRGNIRTLLFFVASLDGFVGIVALQIIYSVFHPLEMVLTLEQIPLPSSILVAMAVALACGILFLWLTRPKPSADSLVLFLLGMCAFGSGLALRLQLSPLFVCMLIGAIVANLGTDRDRVYRTLQAWEQPVYLLFLLLAGAFLRFTSPWVAALAIAYALVRAGGKIAGMFLATRLVSPGFPVPKRTGEGLVTQGGMSVALAVSGILTYQGLEARGLTEEMLFTVVVLGVVISDLAGPVLTADVLRRAGEISPRVEEAIAQGDERSARSEAMRHASGRPRQATGESEETS